jgi:dinuclear metal center YbgI/SA1388 family protein
MCAEKWDNVGLLVGDGCATVRKILVALDATEAVVAEAIGGGFDFLITHHPLIYNPIKQINAADATGKKIIALIKNNIGCYCAHTNLDKTFGGVNDCLAEKLGLTNISALVPEEFSGLCHEKSFPPFGFGRIGILPDETTLEKFAVHVKNSLEIPSLRYAGEGSKKIKKVGVCGGNGTGAPYMDAAIKQNCDVYVTGDLRHHCVHEALEHGIALMDVTHYGSEVHVVEAIVSRLKENTKNEIEIFASSINAQIFSTI